MSSVDERPDEWLEQQLVGAELELREMGVGEAFVDIALRIWLKGFHAGIRESLDAMLPCPPQPKFSLCDHHREL